MGPQPRHSYLFYMVHISLQTVVDSIGLGMQLLAFKAAQRWIVNSQSPQYHLNLPTPLQYGLAHKASSIPGPLTAWQYFDYIFSTNRRSVPPFVCWLVSGMMVQVSLGLITAAADTWLHLTSTTTQWQEVTHLSSPTTNYSRILPSDCAGNPACGITISATHAWINGVAEGLMTINNLSTINTPG